MNQASAALKAKSDKNWDLAEQLFIGGHFNAAATRYYYAVLQSIKAYAVSINKMLGDDPTGNAHREALEIIGFQPRCRCWRNAFIKSKELREKADYAPEDVAPSELQASLTKAQEIRKHHLDKLNSQCQ